MGKEGKGELGGVKAFPAQKSTHLVNAYGALSNARPQAGVGDASVHTEGLWWRYTATVLLCGHGEGLGSAEEEPLLGLGGGT